MIQIRLTEKLRKYLGITPSMMVDPVDNCDLLGHWTANIFTVDRRKAIIFVNDKTLYSFVMVGVKKSTIKDVGELFLNGFFKLIRIDGFENREIENMMNECHEIQLTKTNSRSVLGSINDLIFHYETGIMNFGGCEVADLGEITNRINRIPQRNINWAYSIDVVKSLVKS